MNNSEINQSAYFELNLKAILSESEGGGAFTEMNPQPDGTTAIYCFPHAVGMSWLVRSGNYGEKFGAVPDWVLRCHPYQRSRLCQLALDWNKQLPEARPISLPGDSARHIELERLLDIENSYKKPTRKPTPLTDAIRTEVKHASSKEGEIEPFRLSGRGHETRVTLDRALAQIIREVNIPCVTLSGYGPRAAYPTRVFIRAAKELRRKLGWSPILVSESGTLASFVKYHKES